MSCQIWYSLLELLNLQAKVSQSLKEIKTIVYWLLSSCQLLTVQELLETIVTEVVIQKNDQCTNTSRYQYSYEVVRGKRQAVL